MESNRQDLTVEERKKMTQLLNFNLNSFSTEKLFRMSDWKNITQILLQKNDTTSTNYMISGKFLIKHRDGYTAEIVQWKNCDNI